MKRRNTWNPSLCRPVLCPLLLMSVRGAQRTTHLPFLLLHISSSHISTLLPTSLRPLHFNSLCPTIQRTCPRHSSISLLLHPLASAPLLQSLDPLHHPYHSTLHLITLSFLLQSWWGACWSLLTTPILFLPQSDLKVQIMVGWGTEEGKLALRCPCHHCWVNPLSCLVLVQLKSLFCPILQASFTAQVPLQFSNPY